MKIAKYVIISLVALFAAACAVSQKVETTPQPPELVTVEQAHKAVSDPNIQFVDVRTVEEFASGHAVGTKNLPVESITETLGSLDKNRPVYLICRSGRRSANAAKILSEAGFTEVYDVKGGTLAWMEAGLPIDEPK